jgi:hypothetical protein
MITMSQRCPKIKLRIKLKKETNKKTIRMINRMDKIVFIVYSV